MELGIGIDIRSPPARWRAGSIKLVTLIQVLHARLEPLELVKSVSFRAAFTSFAIALCPILEAGELEPTDERVVLTHPAWPTAESFPAERVTVVEDWLMKK